MKQKYYLINLPAGPFGRISRIYKPKYHTDDYISFIEIDPFDDSEVYETEKYNKKILNDADASLIEIISAENEKELIEILFSKISENIEKYINSDACTKSHIPIIQNPISGALNCLGNAFLNKVNYYKKCIDQNFSIESLNRIQSIIDEITCKYSMSVISVQEFGGKRI